MASTDFTTSGSGRPYYESHGMAESPEYRNWCSLKARCLCKTHKKYPSYGGRGIKVCERWMHSFKNFFADMGARPSPKHTIDRKNNDGDYCPENCRWATARQQARNRPNTILLTFRGETLALAEWAERLGINYCTLTNRFRRGDGAEDALTMPLLGKKRKFTPDQVRNIRARCALGETMKELAKEYRVTPPAIRLIVTRVNYSHVL